ncbi:MAG: hypothetical protein HY304_09605 [candidate division Zixibacteria bacterium]|nr:hypothetical protein [candidate division Zixibacteria bacterium]
MNTRRVMATSLVAGVALMATALAKKPEPGIVFSHKLHHEKVDVACDACHAAAMTATTRSVDLMPKLEDCLACHERETTPWINAPQGPPVFAPRSHEVIFNHQRHVDSLKIDCKVCHATIERSEKIPPHVLPAMSACVECHRQKQVRDDCSVCHSHVETRKPEDHGADWVLDHVEASRRDDHSCETCHKQTYCQECHDGAALGLAIRGKEDAPQDQIGPLASAHEGTNLLVLQRQHDLNYRYTHGDDVKSKRSDCAVCHETQTFCAACHNAGDDRSRLRPAWHDLADFKFYRHADFARNDIESCAGCHDQNAAEPTCLTCHRTIRSPHPEGFMRDVHGSWHEDPDAVCFVCHDAGTRTPGVGFCGKCHGHEEKGD